MKDERAFWEDRYATGDTPWEKGAGHPELARWLGEGNRVDGPLLVPGCGAGHDVRLWAKTDIEVVGLDLAGSAVARAESFPKVGKERYIEASLFDLPAELRGSFQSIWEHTCFCAIDPSLRPHYVEGIRSALRPGGTFLALFYMTPCMDDREEGPPFGSTKEELDGFFRDFELVREWVPTATYEGRESRELVREYRG